MDDGMSSMYGGQQSLRGGKSTKKDLAASDFGLDSASVSGFRQD